MKNQSFTVHMRNDGTDYDRLCETLADPSLPSNAQGQDFTLSMSGSKIQIGYDREAGTLNEAILSATTDLVTAGGIINWIEVHDGEEKREGENLTYGQLAALRGPTVCANEIDRLQHKIVTAQRMVDQNSKVSAILFLDKKHWDQESYSAWKREWADYVDSISG